MSKKYPFVAERQAESCKMWIPAF